MGVNGGSGNQLAFSEIQSFYGGSNPIAISEYYRGGNEVPSTYTTTVTNPAVAPPVPSGWSSSPAHNHYSNIAGNQIAYGTKPAHSGQTSNYWFASYHFTLTPNIDVRNQPNISLICVFGGGNAQNVGLVSASNISYTSVHVTSHYHHKGFYFYNASVSNNGYIQFALGAGNFSGVSGNARVFQGTSTTSTATNNCNTSVPSSGQFSLNIFNNPGTPIG